MDQEREKQVKKSKAKLYNLKSGIEGLVQLIDSGVVQPEAMPDAVGALVARMIMDPAAG